MPLNIKNLVERELSELTGYYDVCGIIDRQNRVYPLGSDTKVLSTIFELITRPIIYRLAKTLSLNVFEPIAQNHYPDFTLLKNEADPNKIAIDVKTTYRNKNGKFCYTLGGYTSFIRPGNESKNIAFPFGDYQSHWIIGFVYDRIAPKKAAASHIFTGDELAEIPLPFENVDYFMQEKWKISSDRAGSGNTTNIGSIMGNIQDFDKGRGVFKDEEEFLEYWRGYRRTKAERDGVYKNIQEFRERD